MMKNLTQTALNLSARWATARDRFATALPAAALALAVVMTAAELSGCRWTKPAAAPEGQAAAPTTPENIVAAPLAVAPNLDGLRPATRQLMKRAMVQVGRNYQAMVRGLATLPTDSDAGFSELVVAGDQIAALGTYLTSQNDPAMPAEYLRLQAEFDENARVVAQAGRVKSAAQAMPGFEELQESCRQCHTTFQVRLVAPYAALGYNAPQTPKGDANHGR